MLLNVWDSLNSWIGGPLTPEIRCLADAIVLVTGEATPDAGMALHFGKTASESLNDAMARWLIDQGASPAQLEDMWIEVHGPGNINSVMLAYWNTQRP